MSLAELIFADEPWGFLLCDGCPPSAKTDVNGAGSPRAFTPLKSKPPRWLNGAGLAPKAGLAFRWKSQYFQAWHVPCSNTARKGWHDLELHCSIEPGEARSLIQRNLLHRPLDDANEHDKEALHLDALINWMVHSFQELGQTKAGEDDANTASMIRRTWKMAQAIWINPKSSEPRMELIIKMAQDKKLIHALHAIGESPRRILIRVRDLTPVGRVQEMDPVCIRHYAKLPGVSPIQKAGPRQCLLSVQRRPSFDTLENKVAAWTMAAMQKRAESWRRKQTPVALKGTRAREVAQLAKANQILLESENLADIKFATLAHPATANYPLTMEPRYNLVYKAYSELLRYQKIKDDAWTWRRPLWCETVSQLVNCCLLQLWPEAFLSTPYYRKEADRGRWLASQSSAGPFKTPWGQAYLIDSHDLESISPDSLLSFLEEKNNQLASLGATGCDMALWWPEKSAILPIWAIIWTDDFDSWQASLLRAGRALAHYADQPNIPVKDLGGLLITAHALADKPITRTELSAGKRIHGLCLPMHSGMLDSGAFDQVITSIKEALNASTEALFR